MKVQAFWSGKIGTMERMCVNSYLKQGIEFDLYSYESLDVPFQDAREIVPESKVALFPWASIFSDYFRYALLAAKGGWWVDMDTVCLKGFDDLPEYVFAQDNIDHYYVSGYVMKAPPAAKIMLDCLSWIDGLTADDRSKLGHMDIGPYLLQKKIPEHGLEGYVAGATVFDPVPWDHVTRLVDSARTPELEAACKDSCLIHLRQSIWNEGPNSSAGLLPDGSKIKTDGEYPDNCYWSILKQRYL